MGKKDELCDFECGMVVAAGVSTSEPAVAFSHNHLYNFRGRTEKEKISRSKRQFSE